MKRVSVIICILALAASLSGQQVTIIASADTSSILIGDQIHFRVSAEIPSGATLNLPVIRDTVAAKVMVLGIPKRDTANLQNGRIRITDDYLITSFEQGVHFINPVICEVSVNGSTKSYQSNIVTLEVVRPDIAPADTTDVIFDIVGPRKAPVVFAEVLPWIIITAVIVLIIWLLMKFLPRNPLRKLITKQKPAEPAHIAAFRDLNNLRAEELWQKGEVKEYYSRLSDILRRYIDGRFGIQSPELTTDETVKKLHKSGFVTNDVLTIVKAILSDADMVKFAKFRPADEVNLVSIDRATQFVTVTKPVEIVSESTSADEKKGGKK